MRLNTSFGFMLPCLTVLAASLHAAEVTAPPAEAAAPANDDTNIAAVITPRLFLFDYFDGVGEDKTHFLERYDYREGLSGDTRSGVFADLDLDVVANNGERDLFILEYKGFGEHNRRGVVRYSDEAFGVTGTYSHYRSATGGIDYLYSPNQVAGGTVSAGPYSTFNDDANRFDYTIDRTRYTAGFKVKPAVLGDSASIALDFEGYKRDGNKFAPFILDGYGDVGFSQERWRGISLNVDERMNRTGLTLTASPKRLFEVAYEVSYEQFLSDAPELQVQRDITDPAGVTLPVGATANDRIASLFYVPDTNLINQGLRLSRNFDDRVMLAAGFGTALLKQESFSQLELAAGHTQGEIRTDNAYLAANARVTPDVSVEGHIKHYSRDNDSTFPDGLINPAIPGTVVAPRINSIDSLDYGLSASWRPDFIGSNLALGWRRLDKTRDLLFGATALSIQPAQSLYREDTLSDEVYLKWSARPAKGWTTRLTPSFIWADQTGLVTEPEEAFMLKAMVSYAAPAGWAVSGFYDYKNKLNSNNTFTDAIGAQTYTQNMDSTLNSAGLSLNIRPRDNANLNANLYWTQDDFSSYLFTTNVQRWNPGAAFTLVDEPNYRIDSFVFNLGGDWQASDKLKLNGSYTFAKSTGDVASGTVLTELQSATDTVDSIIDNTLHSLTLGADYLLNDKTTLRAMYTYDFYDDNAYSLLTGGVNTLAIGISFKM